MKAYTRLTALVCIAAVQWTTTPAIAAGPQAGRDLVIEWNELLQANIPPTANVFSFRYYAMMHIAMFDAANSIERRYNRYHVLVNAPPTASAEAAAAQAAHDVLVALIPDGQPEFEAALKEQLTKITSWRAKQGAAVGKKVAQAVIDWRTGDGTEQPNIAYTPPALPGLWQPTAPGQVAAFVHFANVEPFALLTATQYLPKPPPLLNSDEYAADFDEVKELGSTSSSARSDEQTRIALLFAGAGYSPGPFALWSHVARDAARREGLSLLQTARLFALMSAAMHDGLQTSHTSKFVYNLWRPITAIRRADEDLNDSTIADANWTPLLGTPPYPSHASNLTCIGASAARALARVLGGDAMRFNVKWTGSGGNDNVSRSYNALSQLADEGARSRVYGGIHFNFELTAGHESCRQVADYVVNNFAQRKKP